MRILGGGQAAQTRGLVLGAGVSTSLIVWTSLADPVQLPKFLLVGLFSAWVLGVIIVGSVSGREKKFSLGQWLILAFIAGLLVAGLFTDVKFRALFGTAARSNGGLSYLALAILCAGAMMSFNLHGILLLRFSLVVVGAILSFYGLIQNAGVDPILWVNKYGPIIGTLGNPDFYSGFVGACTVATLWFVFVNKQILSRVLGILILPVQLYLIYKSHSIQGLVAFALGFSIIVITQLWQWRKYLGVSAVVAVSITAPLAFMGILSKGPLASLLAKSTLNNRLDYWQAAWRMFTSHPITGVGLDRFGEYYGQFAPQIQVAQGQSTDNAHNVLLQLLATGGLVVFIPYLALLILIAWTGLAGILKAKGQEQMNLVGLFSVWFALLAVSLVSIDNLGGTVWFWITGGALYAVAKPLGIAEVGAKKALDKKKLPVTANDQNIKFLTPALSLMLVVAFLILAVPTMRSSAALGQLVGNRQQLDASHYVEKLKEAIQIQPTNIDVLGQASNLAGGVPDADLAIALAKLLNKKDPRSFYGNMIAALSYEGKKAYSYAIPFRVRLMEIDKWNTASMIELVKDYVGAGDLVNARRIATKISGLYPGSDAAKTAAGLVNG